jgi:eukaryotic-like serine/threonine-protein kinase
MANQSKQLGHYEILAVVGAGGMGIVYRARDTRLDRQVAVKVLLPDIASNADALARFEREARAVAAISHPNILTIHDFGTHDGSAYAVMEFLEGQTLRAMLDRGPLPVRKSVSLAVQIAHGLAAAHDRNFVHRDLKPENVGLTRSGEVKILDFGLAREPLTRSLGPADATLAHAISRPGVVFGTVGYMSPEQVRGSEVDYRSDLFSFGAVLYEMLTGRRAFARETAAESLTAILNDDPPDLQQSGAKVPPALDRVIRRCLEKHPQDRFHSARDLAFALENALVHTSAELPAVARRTRKILGPAAVIAGSIAVGATAMALWPRAAVAPMSVNVFTSSGADTEPAASRSGDQVAYTSSRDGESTIWIRDLETGGRRAFVEHDLRIPGGHRPRFFADGKRLLYLAPNDAGVQCAWEVPVSGERGDLLLKDVVDAEPSPASDDDIAFVQLGIDASGRRYARLAVFNARANRVEPLLEEKDVDYTSARWSSDGQRVATIRRSSLSGTDNAIVVVNRQSGARTEIKPEGRGLFGALAWNGDGRALIATESPDAQVFVPGAVGRILKIDIASRTQQLLFKQGNLFGLFGSADANATIDVAGDGGLVFSTIEIHQNLRECAISGTGCVDAGGGDRKGAGTIGYANDRQPAYSPDGEFVIFSSNRSGDLDLWVQSTKDHSIAKLTQDRELDWDPAFTADGRGILWSSNRETGNLEIWTADFDRTRLGGANRDAVSRMRRVSADGKDAENPTMTKGKDWVVYASSNAAQPGIWKVHPDGQGAALLKKGALFYIPDVSPDGRYAAYLATDVVNQKNTIHVIEVETSRDTGFQIAVPYRRQLASGDVTWARARWTPDGEWLVFIGQDETGRAVVYKQRFTPGADTSATRQRIVTSLPGAMTESLAVSPDGKFITVSDGYYVRRLALAEHVPGVVGRGTR